MTKGELEEKIKQGKQAYKLGLCRELLANEDLTAYLKRRGYNVNYLPLVLADVQEAEK